MSVTRPRTGLVAIVLLALSCAGCGVVSLPDDGEAAPVPRNPIGIDAVALAGDQRSVEVDFVGGQEFDAADPCSVAYEGTAAIVGEELEIGIFARQHPMPLPPDIGCAAIGYSRTMTLELDEPFAGSVVRDLAGQVFLLEQPVGLVEIAALPNGWALRSEANVTGSETPRWERVWSPVANPSAADGDSMLSLIQSFDGPVGTTGAERQPPLDIAGQRARFWLHPPTGEMVVVWSIGADEVALVGNLRDFSLDEFVEIAEAVRVPAD